MGESDEEVVGVPAEVEPAEGMPESSLVPPEAGEVVSPDAPATVVQAQLALDELLDEFASHATEVEGPAAEEAAAAEAPETDEPAPEESQAQAPAEEPAEAATQEPLGEGLASEEPTESQSADATDDVSAERYTRRQPSTPRKRRKRTISLPPLRRQTSRSAATGRLTTSHRAQHSPSPRMRSPPSWVTATAHRGGRSQSTWPAGSCSQVSQCGSSSNCLKVRSSTNPSSTRCSCSPAWRSPPPASS